MAVSELVGETCTVCVRRWASTADFSRLDVYEGPATVPVGDEIQFFEDAVLWLVRCILCNGTQTIIHQS